MLAKRLIKSNDAGGGACTNTVDLYNPLPDGGGVALYQLNGDATDVSGNYNGTATNVTYGTGQFGQAGVFNGSSSKIVSSSSITGNSARTISVWYKTTSTDNILVSLGTSSAVNNSQFSLAPKTNSLSVYGYVGSGANVDEEMTGFSTNLISGNWTHLVVSWDGLNPGTLRAYVNGALESTLTRSSGEAYNTSAGLQLGTWVFGNRWLNGSLDQVRIFSRALRPYEVEALYTEEYCTPTIVPSEHFSTNVWDGGTIQSINTGFQPDLVWIKSMDVANNHNLADSVRGIEKILYSNLTNSEAERLNSIETTSTGYNLLDTWAGRNSASYNRYVGWSFKAGGAAVTNTDGTITSQVSANVEAGFSIVSYTGNGVIPSTYGHGLNDTPKVVIVKNRDGSSNWTFNFDLTPTDAVFGQLNNTAAMPRSTWMGGTSSVVSMLFENGNLQNANGNDYIAYCFAEVEGFSNFGSYVGTDTRQGIVTGFEPAFVMIKRTDAANAWFMIDNQRFATNKYDRYLRPEVTDAQGGLNSAQYVAFYENGFSVETGSGLNGSGGSYIYMAFAADPTTIEPTLDDSFNTVLYTGNATARSITGVGFQPDFTWIKARSASAYAHRLFDSVRGATKILYSSVTNAEVTDVNSLTSFETDGFNLGNEQYVNGSGIDFVAWNWKGAELPAINSNGSIPSVVSANPAAGFSIVSYTGNGVTGATRGHGLEVEPKMIIVKNRDQPDKWAVYHESIGATDFLVLNDTVAAVSSSAYWNNTSPTSSVFTTGVTGPVNILNENYIAYCFSEVAGFSKFGSYAGTGNASTGATINCGFEPAFVMIKSIDRNPSSWIIHDNKRGNYNNGDIYARLTADSSDAEVDDYPTNKRIDISSTGFTITNASNSWNGSGYTYIYMAFANQF